MSVISSTDFALFMDYFALSVGFHFGLFILIYFCSRVVRLVYKIIS